MTVDGHTVALPVNRGPVLIVSFNFDAECPWDQLSGDKET